jgi:uncharacterized protein
MREWIRGLSGRAELLLVTSICFSYFIIASLQLLLSGRRRQEITTAGVLQAIVFELLLLGAALAILHIRGWNADRLGLRFSWKAALAGVPLFIIYLLVYWVTATMILLVWPGVRDIWLFRYALHTPLWLMFVLIVVNSFFEEVAVTAYVITALEGHGAAVAISASTLLRFAYHLYQGPLASLSIIPLGLLFGTMFWQRRNVWPLAVAHTIANVVAFTTAK